MSFSEESETLAGKSIFRVNGTTFVIDKKYTILELDRENPYNIVCIARNNEDGKCYWLKKFQNIFSDLTLAKQILTEIQVTKHLNHENIIKIVDVLKPGSQSGYNDIYIVTEKMEAELEYIINSPQNLSDDHFQFFLYQILEGVLYMHTADVIHRNLNSRSIFVNSNCDLKITDMYLAASDGANYTCAEGRNKSYQAPEFHFKNSKITKAVDIWSIGFIFAELLGRKPLFIAKDSMSALEKIISVIGTPSEEDLASIEDNDAVQFIRSLPLRNKVAFKDLFPEANPLAIDLLSKMLVFNPDERYTVEECLAHPYFVRLHDPEDEPLCESVFDWLPLAFEPDKDQIQEILFKEASNYHPN